MARKSNAGRKPAYETRIKPRLKEIEGWIRSGMMEKDVIKLLGISKDSWYKAKREQTEFTDVIRNARIVALDQLETEATKSAFGFYVEEEKNIYRRGKDGEQHLVGVEKTKKFIPANASIQKFLLCNWGKDKYSFNPNGDRLREEEFKIKKTKLDNEDW